MPYPRWHSDTFTRVYSVILCSALALFLGFGGFLLDWWGWGWSIFFSLIFFVVGWILTQRRLGMRVSPAWAAVQRQRLAGQRDLAMQSLQDMLPMGKWVPWLRGQVLAQMGFLAYESGKKDKAMELLESASVRVADARLLLACIHFKNGDHKRAFEILQLAAAVHKKHALLHNTYAWMLHKTERSDEAQALLAKFLKRDANNAPTKDNMLRLQNRTRMSMLAFEKWYELGLEQPPQSMGQVRRAPKGFREPPKQAGGQVRRAPKGFREPPKQRGG